MLLLGLLNKGPIALFGTICLVSRGNFDDSFHAVHIVQILVHKFILIWRIHAHNLNFLDSIWHFIGLFLLNDLFGVTRKITSTSAQDHKVLRARLLLIFVNHPDLPLISGQI